MYLLYFLIALLVLLLFIVYYSTGKDILSPPAIMILVFILSVNFAAINGIEWKINFRWKSFCILLTGILSFVIPYILLYSLWRRTPRVSVVTKEHNIKIETWKIVLASIVDLVILFMYRRAIYKLVGTAGYSGTNIQWAFRYLTSYEGSESLSGYIRLLTKFIDATAYIFVFVFINNVLIYKKKMFNNCLLLVAPTIFVIKTLLSGGRQDLLKITSFVFICAYILNRNKIGWKKEITLKYLFRGMLVFIIAIPLFYYSLTLTGRTTTRTFFVSISTYIGGPIQHFNQYIVDPIEKSPFFGNETLTPILNTLGKLGVIDYHNTIHLEYRRLGITIGNVYTFFRRPLQDFGITGMYLFTVFVSLFFSYIYVYHIRNKKNTLGNNLNTIIYVYLLYWIVLSSIEQYSMTIISLQTVLTIVAFVLLWKFLFCVRFKHNRITISKWKKTSRII